MPSPHSYDLRKRVIAHFEKHGSATLTSETFNISRSIIYDWKKRKEATGDIKAKKGYQKGYGHKIQDLNELKKQVEANPGLTLAQVIKKMGIKMSVMTCSRGLKKLNMTRKKRPLAIKSKTKKNDKHS